MNDVRKVILTKWNSTPALAAMAGGLHYDQAPPNAAKPHCVFRQLPSFPGDRVLGGIGGVDRPRIQFQVFDIGADNAGTWAKLIIAAFDPPFVGTTDASDEVKFFRDTPEITTFDSYDGNSQPVYQSNVIYDLFVNRVI